MTIHNFNEFATAFNTTPAHIESTLSNLAHMDLTVENTPTRVRISHFVGECNMELLAGFIYPFDSRAVTEFLNDIEISVNDLLSIYDDPIEMLMNTTNPGEHWTIEDAGRCLSEAEANGWNFSASVDPQYILDLYNDMEGE